MNKNPLSSPLRRSKRRSPLRHKQGLSSAHGMRGNEEAWHEENPDVDASGHDLSKSSSILAPFITKMKEILAKTMQIPLDDISVKATTTEQLGFTGTEDGIAAYATVLIIKN